MRDDIADIATPALPIFTPANYVKLCENEYFRYMPNSPVIAHALMGLDGRACQFELPDRVPGVIAPVIGELANLSEFQLANNKKTLLGFVDKTPMISRRAYSISVAYLEEAPVNYTFYPLSPKKNPMTHEDRPIIYDATRVARFQDTEAARAEIGAIECVKKTGAELVVNNADVPRRMAQKGRTPDQNTVMGRHAILQAADAARRQRNENIVFPKRASHSAVEEMKGFLEQYRDILTPDMISILSDSVRAPLRGYASQARGEWLHRDGHNLHPMDQEPQRADNLGAAEKRYNTEMMIGERTVQFFALNVPQSRSKIKCDFDMLLDSELIDMIHFVACIQVANFTFKIMLNIDVFQKEPQCVKASDLAVLIGILFCFMHKQAPRSILPVATGCIDAPIPRAPIIFFQVAQAARAAANDDDEDMRLLLG